MAIITQFPKPINVNRCSFGTVIKVIKAKKEFRIYVKHINIVKVLYFSLPCCGGIRIHNGNTGFFEAEEKYLLEYRSGGSNTLTFNSVKKDIYVEFTYDENKWKVDILDPDKKIKKTLLSSEMLFGFDDNNSLSSVKLVSPISHNEVIYGLGERFNSVAQHCSVIPIWNFDCCNPPMSLIRGSHEKTQGYKNVPMVHSSNGFTMFFNTFNAGTANIGEWEPDCFFLEFAGNQFDLFIWIGTVKQNISSYYKLTGYPYLPPRWAAEYWAGGGRDVWNCNGWGSAVTVSEESVNKYKENGISVKNYYIEVKPTPEIFELANRNNINILFWTDSILRTETPSDFSKKDIKVRKNSNPEQYMPGDYVDFTNPNSICFINDKYDDQWNSGAVHGVMIDYADNVYEDSLFYNGKTGTEMHNAYAYWYAKRFYEAWDARLGDDFMLFQRSGCAGSQHWAGSFGGDLPANSTGLRRALNAGISAANSGFTIWGSDIGGFCGPQPSADIYVRWLEFGTFSPLMRSHGILPRDPWYFGESAVEAFKKYYWLRYGISDTVYSSMINAKLNGETVLRSFAVEYNNDPRLVLIDDEYIFCDNLLVCPIIEENVNEREIIFPNEVWYDFWDGSKYEQSTAVVHAETDMIPVFVREGAAIPLKTDANGCFTEKMKNQETSALLISDTEKENVSTIYTSEEEVAVIRVSGNKNLLKVLTDEIYACGLVIVYGVTPKAVFKDGKELVGSAYTQESGKNITVINIHGEWKEIVIEKNINT